MVSTSCDMVYKILLLGDSSVGKTCFLLRFTEDTFTDNHISTIGVDYKLKIINSGDKIVKLQVWDTAGQDRFRSITKNYFRGSHGIILIYDITSTNSFNNIKTWLQQIREALGNTVIILLVGNKLDLEQNRRVSKEEGQQLASDNKMGFYETSAKDGTNTNEAFEYLYGVMSKKSEGKKIEAGLIAKEKKKCCYNFKYFEIYIINKYFILILTLLRLHLI
jgi:Ras-related protein Rab-1A